MSSKKEKWEEPDREEVIRNNPLLDYCEARGWRPKHDGAANRYKCRCPLPGHEDKTPSFTIYADQNTFYCFGCLKEGTVIDVHMEINGMSSGMEAMCDLAGIPYRGGKKAAHGSPVISGDEWEQLIGQGTGSKQAASPAEPKGPQKTFPKGNGSGEPKQKETAVYDYQDATGRVVYQVVRYEPKTFKQCRIVDEERFWSMDGVERLPYRLPELLAHPASVWIVEGEKDVETLRAAGQTATCNPGGVGKWLPAFSQHLRGKCVYLAPDNDDVGQKHMRSVLESLRGLVEWVKWVELPREFDGSPVKDVSDLRAACKDEDEFESVLKGLQNNSRLIERGIDSRCRTMAELEADYIANLSRRREVSLSLGNWLPGIGVRALGPGDLMGILADTAQMKSATVLNILAHNADLQAVIFSLELTGGKMFERGAAIAANVEANSIEGIYLAGKTVNWRESKRFRNLLVCPGVLTMGQIDEEVVRSSAKFGCPPKVIVIDYAQLTQTPGNRSRYERMSDVCENARILANKHHLVVVLVSQVHRGDSNNRSAIKEVTLHDAKDSGSFENSCSLILGQWKTSKTTMRYRVLKDSRGVSGATVDMDIRGGTYIIDPASATP